MFIITDAASDKATELLTAEGKAGWGLRITIEGSGCCGPSYGMDIDENPAEGDEVTEKNGLRVFADKDTHEKLSGMIMDFIDDGQRQGFVIKAEGPSSCACPPGSSCP
jgi:iron-sulfur cluster assembly protein